MTGAWMFLLFTRDIEEKPQNNQQKKDYQEHTERKKVEQRSVACALARDLLAVRRTSDSKVLGICIESRRAMASASRKKDATGLGDGGDDASRATKRAKIDYATSHALRAWHIEEETAERMVVSSLMTL